MITQHRAGYGIMVCYCCYATAANGECCEDDYAHECGPLVLIDPSREITCGWVRDERLDESDAGDALGFSWRTCEGCGSRLGGERYMLTVWAA